MSYNVILYTKSFKRKFTWINFFMPFYFVQQNQQQIDDIKEKKQILHYKLYIVSDVYLFIV